ncbi:MAG: hypothetical protein QOK16_4537 [Solirubrobacteraceae bacterium]|jgi:biotin carboxylase/tryptophan 2,3-dioxygenase|nr:hypothetical protein [Solirubrobacteraceae bacterium]
MNQPTILLVGYSMAWQQVIGSYQAGDSVTFVEEPDVVRKRDVHASLATTEPIFELVEWEYQRPGAADQFYLAHRDLRPVAIVPVLEYAVPFAARLAERYGMPGAGARAAELLCDKHLLRQVAGAAGIANPRSLAVNGPDEVFEFMRQHGGPVVLKPANRQASVGTRVLRELAEVQSAWQECIAQDEGIFVPDRPRPLRMLVEQFVEGDEFSVELVVRDGEGLFCNVTGKVLFPGTRPVEQAHTVPASIPPALTALLRGETLRVLEAVGFHTGFAHCEWIVSGGVPHLVECAGRMPGDSIVPLIMRAWQADVVEWFLTVMRGQALEQTLPTHAPGGAAAWFLHTPPGEVVSVRGLEDARSMEGVTSAEVSVQPGDRTFELRSSWDRVGCVLTAAASADAALELARRAADSIAIDVITDSGPVTAPEPPLEPADPHDVGVANERGVIAEHYYSLHSIASVEATRASSSFSAATPESRVLGLVQAAEIALYNLADLLGRAASDLDAGDFDRCSTKMCWARGFHRVLVRLSLAAIRAGDAAGRPAPEEFWRIDATPGFAEYLPALQRFDATLRRLDEERKIDALDTFARAPLGDPVFTILHAARIANHDSRTWSVNFERVIHPAPGTQDLKALLATHWLRNAVEEHRLSGDTYFTQFRALHQIPELLAREVNDSIEIAIHAIRCGDIDVALDALEGALCLADPIEACLPPIVDNLTTRDYHDIRENLGLTSGSHSVSLRFHLFTELYEQLCDAVAGLGDEPADEPLVRRIRRQVVTLHTFIFAWRDMHLHLPRNNLGGAATKSLTGSPDAIRTVRKMRDNAAVADASVRFTQALPVRTTNDSALAAYLDSPSGSDALLLAATGEATKANFSDVQERAGFFAQRCPFTRPPRRTV